MLCIDTAPPQVVHFSNHGVVQHHLQTIFCGCQLSHFLPKKQAVSQHVSSAATTSPMLQAMTNVPEISFFTADRSVCKHQTTCSQCHVKRCLAGLKDSLSCKQSRQQYCNEYCNESMSTKSCRWGLDMDSGCWRKSSQCPCIRCGLLRAVMRA